jgi:DNA-binding transcriptional regulator YhcF (GntR family)
MEADVTGVSRSSVERVSDELRARIAPWAPGTRLPTHHKLTEEFGVSRDTVQRALKELRDEGLIISEQGRGSFVADRVEETPGDDDYLEPSIVALDHYLDRAFQEPRVTIDYFGFSAETLDSVLKPRLDRLRLPDCSAPESLVIRLLLPDLDTPLDVPRSVADRTDPRPLERIRRKTQRFIESLNEAVLELPQRQLVPEARIEVRTVRTGTQVKLYILNGERALRGWYKVFTTKIRVPMTEGEGSEELEIYDHLGLDAALIPQSPSATAEAQEWFDSLWSTIAEDYRLNE